jgi:hypothetical protein
MPPAASAGVKTRIHSRQRCVARPLFEFHLNPSCRLGVCEYLLAFPKAGFKPKRLDLNFAVAGFEPAGILSVPGVYGGLLDKISFGGLMNKGLTIRTVQTHVNR